STSPPTTPTSPEPLRIRSSRRRICRRRSTRCRAHRHSPNREESPMRQDIEFDAEGTTLRGWLYVPDEATGPVPAIVMCHGYSAVKELCLDAYAEVFCEAGFAALVYDNRCLGASDGEPRQEIDPWAQVNDYRHAITYARTREEIDPDRIGVWGSSY